MVNQIIVILVSILFGGLLSFFITTLTQRKVFKSIAQELNTYHEKIHHRIPVKDQIKEEVKVHEKKCTVPENEIKEHESRCIAVKDIMKLKTGMIWLVVKAGGNPSDLGLN